MNEGSGITSSATTRRAPPAGPARVILRAREEGRILRGHRWVFSNEIRRVEGDAGPGTVVDVVRGNGRAIGRGFYNPHSLIAVRLVSGAEGRPIDRRLLVSKIRKALTMREWLYPETRSFRVVHGESDDLPGLIVDKFEDCLVMQTFCYGLDRIKDTVCDALEEVFSPRCIVERNESHLRQREGLPSRSGVLRGDAPERVRIAEGDLEYEVDLLGGQKTGFYFDQRENRFLMRRYVKGRRVLDGYCHDGGFTLNAVRGGAAAVLGLDIARDAIEKARRNALLNELESQCQFEALEVGEALESLERRGERFDVVILDPPSFTRSRKQVATAKRGYTDLNRKAIRLLPPGGILATATCSFHITDETFSGCIQEAAFRLRRGLRLLEWRTQAPDHPVLPTMPETRYLKFGVFQVD